MSLESFESTAFRCGRSGEAACAASADGTKRPFPLPGTKTRWSRDRKADIHHVRLEVALDFDRRSIAGTATHLFTPVLDGLASLELDCVDLEVRRVRMKGRSGTLPFTNSDGTLSIRFPRPLPAGRRAEVSIEYSGTPRRGLYFCGPDEHYPHRRVEAWTQGQDEDSRHWFPCFDYPNQKAATEVLATVPARMTALSNGRLVRRTLNRAKGTATFHWRQAIPHVSYLVTLVAGEFEPIHYKWRKVPLTVWTPKGRRADAERCCGKTADMMGFFSEFTGEPYPYEKYDQVFVQDFIFGGMENTTATTLTDTALLDRRSFLDASMDGLVAHELAHQWFGDLLTCRDWSQGWLNEGFATYFDALYKEHDLGRDEYLLQVLSLRDNYLAEDGGHYRRSIVTKRYRDPVEIFDRHLYEKGALVLHMLRNLLGDDLFRRSIRRYVRRHRGANVETVDLRRAVEEETGRNLEFFFHQWVYKAGHPDLKATFAWDDKTKTASVTVKQGQGTEDDTPHVFRMPVTVRFGLGGRRHQDLQGMLDERENVFRLKLASRPKWVSFDPGFKVLKTLDFSPPRDMLVAQLEGDDDVVGRVHAAGCLGKEASPAAVEALGRCLAKAREFWGVRAAAAAALGKACTGPARDLLLKHIRTDHPKVRRAVARALGEWRGDARAADALHALVARGDPSYLVEAEAASALGRTRSPRAFELLARVYDDRPSWNEVVRSGALAGLAALRDVRGVEKARDAVRPGKHNALRGSGVPVLAKLAEVKDAPRTEIGEEIAKFVEDWWLRVKIAACGAAADLGEEKALPALARAAEHDLDGRVRRVAAEAAQRIRTGKDRGAEVKKLREDLEGLREDLRRLRDEVRKKK
jgi:aminopeptidase N